jgi:hypothetical protein
VQASLDSLAHPNPESRTVRLNLCISIIAWTSAFLERYSRFLNGDIIGSPDLYPLVRRLIDCAKQIVLVELLLCGPNQSIVV